MFVANSRHVAERIERYYGRAAEVVHPPVDVRALPRRCRARRQDYYLVFGRVVPYKRVDLAVAACARLGRPLKVGGDGRALEAVRAAAPPAPSVEFLGRVARRERDELLGGARALLFPGEEDFGIVPVEAQAAGLPVIAYGVGGAARDGARRAHGGAVRRADAAVWRARSSASSGSTLDRSEVRANAERFGRERFRAEMAAVIDAARTERSPVNTH